MLASIYNSDEDNDLEDADSILYLDTQEISARARGGTSLRRSLASIHEQRENTKLSIVISHCDKSIDWIPSYIGEGIYGVTDITIVTKCKNKVEGIESLKTIGSNITVTEVELDNVGRCDHSFAHWIENNVQNTDEETDGKDLVLFMKDSDRLLPVSRTFEESFTIASTTGFACFRKPFGNGWSWKKYIPLTLHRKSQLDLFQMSSYNRTGLESGKDFKSSFRTLGDFRKAMGIIYPEAPLVPVCYGGMFMTQKRGLLKQPQEVWSNLTEGLSRGNNIEEGHFVERLWATLVSPQSSDKALELISESALRKIDYEEDQYSHLKGLTYVRDWANLVKRFTGIHMSWWNHLYDMLTFLFGGYNVQTIISAH